MNILACQRIHQFEASVQAPINEQKLGFRFTKLPECLLVTQVVSGYGAEQSGLEKGDCILSVQNQQGADAVRVLQDVTQATVQLDVHTGITGELRQVIVHRVPYQLSIEQDPALHPMLIAASNGDVGAMNELLSGGAVPFDTLEQATKMLARYFPQRQVAWLSTLEEPALTDAWLASVLIQHYAANKDWSGVLRVYQMQPSEIQIDWGRWSPVTMRYVLRALWEMEEQSTAISLARRSQSWGFETGLERVAGLAPLGGEQIIDTTKEPIVAGLNGVAVDGVAWSLDDQPWSVINFWATWCHPCQQELPHLQAWLAQQSNAQVLAVNMNDDASVAGIRKTLHQWEVEPLPNWKNIIEPDLARTFEVEALPTLILLDQSGVEFMRIEGYLPDVTERLTDVLHQGRPTERLAEYRGPMTVDWLDNPAVKDLAWDGQQWWMLSDTLYHGSRVPNLTPVTPSVALSENHGSDRLFVAAGKVLLVDTAHSICRMVQGGNQRWYRTFPTPFVDAVWYQDLLLVALTDRLLIFNTEGVLQHTLDVSVQNLQVISQAQPNSGVNMRMNGIQTQLSLLATGPVLADVDTARVMQSVISRYVVSSGYWTHLDAGSQQQLTYASTSFEPVWLMRSSHAFIEANGLSLPEKWVVFPDRGLLKIGP